MGEAQQEKPADAWGQPISEERQRELQGYLDRWAAESDHGARKGPFDKEPGIYGIKWGKESGVPLTGADVAWLAATTPGDEFGRHMTLHLEGAYLLEAHLEYADLRWAHLEYANLMGAYLDRAELDGAHLEHADCSLARLRYASLDGAFMEGADLHYAFLNGTSLHRADLENADLSNAHLEDTKLGEATLEGVNLQGAKLDTKTQLSGATLNARTRLGDIQWGGVGSVNLTQIDWSRVPSLGDEAGVGRHARASEHTAVVRAYRQLAAQLRAQGMNEVADRFLYRAQIRQRKLLFRRGRIPQWLGSWFLAALAGYGFRPGRTILWYLAVVGGFATAYFLFGPNSAVHLTWNEALVVSLTAFHGRGFFATTFQPGDPLAALAAGEAVIGLLIEISFIATFTQRFFNSR